MSRQRDTDAIELIPKPDRIVRPDEAQDDEGSLPTLGRIPSAPNAFHRGALVCGSIRPGYEPLVLHSPRSWQSRGRSVVLCQSREQSDDSFKATELLMSSDSADSAPWKDQPNKQEKSMS